MPRCCRGPVGLRPFLLGSKANVLFFVCAPLAFVAEAKGWGAGITFILAMLAIAPLAERLGYLTEQVACHTNDTLGGMLNATFGNSVETLISVVALLKAKDAMKSGNMEDSHFFLTLIQTSLLGSMLSNLLLVQGSAFFLGGLRHPMQQFSREGAVTSAGLLVLVTLALGVPTMLWSNQDQISPTDHQLGLSRFVSICLLIIYTCFLVFQLRTHRFLFEKASEIHKAHKEFEAARNLRNILPTDISNHAPIPLSQRHVLPEEDFHDVELTPTPNGASKASGQDGETGRRISLTTLAYPDDDMKDDVTAPPITINSINSGSVPSLPEMDEHEPSHTHEAQIGLFFAIIYLTVCTIAVGFVSHVVVEAAEGAVESLHLNPTFIGGVAVPIVGNAAEHASALMFAWRDKMDTALAIAVGSAIQIPMFVLPMCILIGWIAEVPLTLNLDQFMMTIVVVTSLALAFTLHAGQSHWLHGLILIFEYLIIAAAFWFK